MVQRCGVKMWFQNMFNVVLKVVVACGFKMRKICLKASLKCVLKHVFELIVTIFQMFFDGAFKGSFKESLKGFFHGPLKPGTGSIVADPPHCFGPTALFRTRGRGELQCSGPLNL